MLHGYAALCGLVVADDESEFVLVKVLCRDGLALYLLHFTALIGPGGTIVQHSSNRPARSYVS